MYERSAIVLEKYIEKLLEFNKQYNLKDNYERYNELIDEVENYEIISTKENEIIQEFDETVKELEAIQKQQDKLTNENLKLEEERNKLFYVLDESENTLTSKFEKIENKLEKNNEQIKQLRIEFIKYLTDFSQRQKERNKCEKERRIAETRHIEYIKKIVDEFNSIDSKDLLKLKQFMGSDKEEEKQEVLEIMLKNGQNEKIGFNENILKSAIEYRMKIAEREVQCYMVTYDKTRRILAEIENDNLKIEKYKKALRDNSIKINFLNAEKDYIVGFLDYERMATISGIKMHKKLMEEACKNFETDVIQIENLYELVLREIANKGTKKAYKELYNKTYLNDIESKEKNFEEKISNLKINMGAVLNSNYWRIEGIKNIYEVFQDEISEKFGKDMEEFKLEEQEEKIEVKQEEVKNKAKIIEKPKEEPEEKYEDKNKFIDDIFDDMDLEEEEFDDDYYDEDESNYEDIDEEFDKTENFDYEDDEEDSKTEDFDYEDIDEEEYEAEEKQKESDYQEDDEEYDDENVEKFEDDEEYDDEIVEEFEDDEETEKYENGAKTKDSNETDEEDFWGDDEEDDEYNDEIIDDDYWDDDDDNIDLYEINLEDEEIVSTKKNSEAKKENKKTTDKSKSTTLRKSARGRKKKEAKEEKEKDTIFSKIFKDKKK